MIVRSKTKVRVLILLAGLAILLGGAATVFIVRKHHSQRIFAARRSEGIAHYQKGEYAQALDSLGSYVKRQEYAGDAEAIYAFAESLLRVDMPGGRNLPQAMGALQRVLSIQPGRTDVQRELLDLYTQLNYNIEAVDLAEKILEKDKNDLQALRAKARGLAARQQNKEALAVCEQVNALVPLDLEIRVLSLDILRELNEQRKIFETATEIYSSKPTDPRAELIFSIALSRLEEINPTQSQYITDTLKKKYPNEAPPRHLDPFTVSQFFAFQAAQRDSTDLTFIQFLIDQLDRTRLVEVSLTVLRKFDAQQDLPWVRNQLVHRLWESARYAEVLKRMEKIEITGTSSADVELLAIRGVAQARTDQKEAATQTATTLANLNKEDRAAQAWAAILQELFLRQNADTRRAIDSIQAALEVQRNNAYLRYFLGLAYFQLGERDSATEAFSQVISTRPLWQLPLLHRSRLLLEAGQKQAALEDANEAWLINQMALPARANLAIIAAANTDLSTLDTNSALFKFVADIRRDYPAEESTLHLWVQLLAKTRQPEEAKTVINNTLAAANPPGASTFLRLAAVSRENNLGLEEACFAAAEKSADLTPEIALARATAIAEAGNPAAAAKYLEDAVKKSGPTDVNWRLAFASFLDQIKDSRAAANWIALADDPSLNANLSVQHDALAAPSTQSDAAFLSRTVERIRAVAGEKSVGWKLAQARLQLRDPAAANTDTLVKSLSDIVSSAPANVDARLLLAAAYEKSRNVPAAIEQMTAARKLQPASKILSLELARLYTLQLDFQRAREIVEPMPPTSLDPVQRRAAARIIGQQGNIKRAIEFLEGVQADAPALDRLYLADLYRRANQYEKAEAIYKSLLENPDRLEVIMAAADYYASRGQNDLAMAALAKLDKISIRPAEKDFALAEYNARHDNPDQALSRYLAVVQTEPARFNGWRSLVIEYIRLNKPDEAVAAANKALAALSPTDGQPFHNVIASAGTLRIVAGQKSLLPLVAGLLEPAPEGEAAAQALPIIAKAIESHADAKTVAEQLRPIADSAPKLASLQMLLVQNYLIANNNEEAAAIALRSLRLSPASPEIARNAAIAVAAARHYSQALAPAQQWRELTPENPLPADLFVAELHMSMEDYAAVLRDLQPHLEKAKANPKDLAPVLLLRAHAHLRRGEEPAAFDLLSPFLPAHPKIRSAWRDLTQLLPNQLAEKWITRLAAATPADDVNENLELAIVWHGLFSGRPKFRTGTNDPKHEQAANAVLDHLITLAPDNPLIIQGRAILAQSANKLGAAEQSYRRALELKPDMPICLNNLAMILTERGEYKEALSFAQRALTVRPNDPSIHDTLATVQFKLKENASAMESLKKAATLDPRNIDRRIKLAQACLEIGQTQDLPTLLDEIEKMSSDAKLTDTQRDAIRQLRAKFPKTALR